eukprot:scaffold21887_cov114-Isochrysis_galbana.AAC.1
MQQRYEEAGLAQNRLFGRAASPIVFSAACPIFRSPGEYQMVRGTFHVHDLFWDALSTPYFGTLPPRPAQDSDMFCFGARAPATTRPSLGRTFQDQALF